MWYFEKLTKARVFSTLFMGGGVGVFVFGVWAVFWAATPYWSEPRLSAKPAPAPPYIEKAWANNPPTHRRIITAHLGRGDSLTSLLARHNISAGQAQAALNALTPLYDPRKLPPNKAIRIYFEWQAGTNGETRQFTGFDFLANPRQRMIIRYDLIQDKFTATKHERVLHERHFFIDALITSSIYESAREHGMSANAVARLLRLFSFTTDFQRDIRRGDRLEILYSRRFDDAGRFAEEGTILFAALTNRGARRAFWHLQHDDGSDGYYDMDYKSVKRLLMSTPIDGARLSSPFGLRRDPISGYTRRHLGIDFAAPIGTAIYAAGDGTITDIGTKGAYGKYIRIRHNNNYATAYAHLSRYAKGLRKGSRVKQTQTIGYVGNTGRSTGPHLHYEVLHNGKAINPRNVVAPSEVRLSAAERIRLDEVQKSTATLVNQLAAAATPNL